MCLWWIVCIASAVLAIVFWVWCFNAFDGDNQGFAAVIFSVIALSIAIACGCSSFISKQETNLFEAQKAFLESYTPVDGFENATITGSIVEYNAWLYDAQFKKERYGNWSFYDDRVLELTPITRTNATEGGTADA